MARRCADLADLLAAAAAGLAAVAMVSADLRSLDRAALAHLRDCGVAVVGVYPPGDEAAERHLRQLGIDAVVAADADGTLLQATVDALGARRTARADGRRPRPRPRRPARGPAHDRSPGRRRRAGPGARARRSGPRRRRAAPGVLIAVWGPTGAPGRTTLAVNLATELSRTGARTLLVDADTYGGCVAQVLSLLDEAPGFAAATRAADHGTLDLPGLARLAPEVAPGLRVLTGIPKAERWPELRGAGGRARPRRLSRRLARFTVVDCGFSLEDDEELQLRHPRPAAQRRHADRARAGRPRPRRRRGRPDRAAAAGPRAAGARGPARARDPVVVVNKVRASRGGSHGPSSASARPWPASPACDELRFVPDDREVLDAALLAGRALAETAPTSAARRAIAAIADDYAGAAPAPAGRSRWRRR